MRKAQADSSHSSESSSEADSESDGPVVRHDARLIADIQRGDPGACRQFTEEQYPFITRLLKRWLWLYGQPKDWLENLVQEAFLRIFSNIDQLRDPGVLDAWMVRICHRLVISEAKRHQRRAQREVSLDSSVIEDLAVSADFTSQVITWVAVEEILDKLPQRDRELLLLFYAHGMCIAEIAVCLNKGEGAVKQALYRARANARALAYAMPYAQEVPPRTPA